MTRSLAHGLKTVVLLWITLLALNCAAAEVHHATRLGNPATRFADPLTTPDDLRARFRDEKLRPDFISVLQQFGWRGDPADMFRAAASAEVKEIQIAKGTVMPFMSTREHGRAICLRNVIWEGAQPAPAYTFLFTSKGQRYRCTTPKACSNFFVEDLGAEPKSMLTVSCSAPNEILAGRPIEVCLQIKNSGNAAAGKSVLNLSIPEGAKYVRATEGGVASETTITWNFDSVPAGSVQQACAYFAMRQPAELAFQSNLISPSGQLTTSCSTKVLGIPAILLEVEDLEDPIEVGKEVTYVIKVTNQGSAQATNVRLTCKLPSGEEFISGGGPTTVQAQNGVITVEALADLAPKGVATWRVIVKAIQAQDARFRVELTSDQFKRAIEEEESTELY